MLVKDLIKAHECCYQLNGPCDCTYCKECPLVNIEKGKNCQAELAQFTVDKLREMEELLADKHYNLIEELQEKNSMLSGKLDKVMEILNEY